MTKSVIEKNHLSSPWFKYIHLALEPWLGYQSSQERSNAPAHVLLVRRAASRFYSLWSLVPVGPPSPPILLNLPCLPSPSSTFAFIVIFSEPKLRAGTWRTACHHGMNMFTLILLTAKIMGWTLKVTLVRFDLKSRKVSF